MRRNTAICSKFSFSNPLAKLFCKNIYLCIVYHIILPFCQSTLIGVVIYSNHTAKWYKNQRTNWTRSICLAWKGESNLRERLKVWNKSLHLAIFVHIFENLFLYLVG